MWPLLLTPAGIFASADAEEGSNEAAVGRNEAEAKGGSTEAPTAEEKGDEANSGSHGAPTVEEGRTARATAAAAAAAEAPAASEAQGGGEASTAEEAEGGSNETPTGAEKGTEAGGGCIGAPAVTATGPGDVRNVKSTGKKKRPAPVKAAALAAAAAVKYARNVKSKANKEKSALEWERRWSQLRWRLPRWPVGQVLRMLRSRPWIPGP